MSIYKVPTASILEIRLKSAHDWYGNRMWFTVDKKCSSSFPRYVKGYVKNMVKIKTTKYSRLPEPCDCYERDYGIAVESIIACSDTDKLRLKLTNSRQRCKIFSVYRRPQCNVPI